MSSDATAPTAAGPSSTAAPTENAAGPSSTAAPTENAASPITTAAPTEKKMIVLRSCDGQVFEVEEKVARLSETVKNMVEDCEDSTLFPLPNVTAPIMKKFIEYSKQHVEAAEKAEADPATYTNEDLKKFDKEFVNVRHEMLLDLILAANYLNLKSMLDLGCQAIADVIKDMTPEEVREVFHVENDYTPEEEAAVRNENLWAFE